MGRSTARFRRGDLLGSAADASKASGLDPQDPAAAAARGRAAYALGEYETAREAYGLAALLEPSKKLHASWRDMCDRRLGREPETETEDQVADDARATHGKRAKSPGGKKAASPKTFDDKETARSKVFAGGKPPGSRTAASTVASPRSGDRPTGVPPPRTSGGASTSSRAVVGERVGADVASTGAGESRSALPLVSPGSSTPQPARLQWFQSPNAIEISLLIKGLSLSDVAVDVSPDSVTVRGLTDKGQLAAKRIALARRVDPAGVSVVARATKIEIRAQKESPGELWKDLGEEKAEEGDETDNGGDGVVEGDDEGVKRGEETVKGGISAPVTEGDSLAGPAQVSTDALSSATAANIPPASGISDPSVPALGAVQPDLPRPYASKRTPAEWDRLVADMSAEDVDDESEDAAGFFRKLYATGDDDFRRAMVKSFVESGGTALSTSWDDVASSDGPGQWTQGGGVTQEKDQE